MRIAAIEIEECILPKADSTWRFALAASPDTRGHIVRIVTDDGPDVGLGYASTKTHIGAGHAQVRRSLDRIVAVIVGSDPLNINACLDQLAEEPDLINQAVAGIEMALLDLAGKALGVPVSQLLGGAVANEIPVLRIVPIKRPAEMAAAARALVADGISHLKLKVEGTVDDDVERIRRVREAVGSSVHLTIDANQAYQPDVAVRAIEAMAPARIDLVEQPVAAGDLDGLRYVRERSSIPIEADESAGSVQDVYRLASASCVDGVSVKIDKMGGIGAARAAASICRAAGMYFRLGACVGSQILVAAALHWVASEPGVWYPAAEVGEFARLLNDPARGLSVTARGTVPVPKVSGLGVSIEKSSAAVESATP